MVKKVGVAILGLGVVGGGTYETLVQHHDFYLKTQQVDITVEAVLDKNLERLKSLGIGDEIIAGSIEEVIANPAVDIVIETIGGIGVAKDFVTKALRDGKTVVTSNKELICKYSHELERIAKRNHCGLYYEASCVGGVPIIRTLLDGVQANHIRSMMGIVNGTTNYILTKMFSFGDSFESALSDAQAKGYAERNPDADVLGTDAARKITILSALATGSLVPVTKVETEGITKIRKADVVAAEKIGCSIKLLGRCILNGDAPYVFVAPFMLSSDSALSGVCGVYNAVEVVAEPLGNVMFYGKGAGAGATASAVVGDLMQTVIYGSVGLPTFEKTEKLACMCTFSSRRYFAYDGAAKDAVAKVFGKVDYIDADECAFVCPEMSEKEAKEKQAALSALGFEALSSIRIL